MADNSDAIAEFVSITGARPEQAKQFLDLTNSNVQEAIDMYFQSQEESGGEDPNEIVDDEPREPSESYGGGYTAGGGRRLGGEGEPIPEPSASSIPANSRSKVQPKKKFSSLKDLQSDGHEGHAHGNDEDDRASDKEQEFYAGGDKSGLAVQDPSNSSSRDPIQRLMNTARRGGPRPPRSDGLEDQPARPSYFSGAGQTLGGDEAESRPVPAANAGRQRPVEMVERVLHLWEDGFSIDDGQLFRYDDPANRRILDMINSGSAPMDLMNVQDGQAVDVKLADHRGEKYVQPKKKYKPFEGSGQRLGSPTPGPAITTTTTPSTASNVQATPPSVEVNDSQPTVSIQVRLADGTRMPARFNTTHTIGDIYAFVDRAVPGGHGRPFVLATTFPTKDLTDKSQILGDMAEFKRGGVVVQKWT